MADIEQRLTSLEERLARIEEQLARKPTPEIQTNPYERAPSPMRQSVPA